MKVGWTLTLLSILGMGWIAESANNRLRDKRQLYPPPLVNPFGGNFKINPLPYDLLWDLVCHRQLIMGVAVPVQLSGKVLVYGQNFQFQYALPENATFFTNLFQDSQRRRRSASWSERTPIYDILERELDRRNIDGRSCLMKDICEAAATPMKDEGLVGELLHLLLTPDNEDSPMMDEEYLKASAIGRRHGNCSMIYSACPVGLGILDRISTVY